MTRDLSYLIGIICTILIGMFLYFTLCSDCHLAAERETTDQVVPAKIPDPTSFPFAFDDGGYAYDVADNFNFNLSSDRFLTPLSPAVERGINGLRDYLKAHPEKAIDITGLYKSNEGNPTAWPNLGLARANAVKNHFVELGIPSSQTHTFSKEMDAMVPKGNTLLGPVTYVLTDRPVDEEAQAKALHDKIQANPLVLYFDTGEASIVLSPEQRQKVADIAHYLDMVESASCSIIGHADNTGSKETNVSLGQERANFAKAYFIRNGIPEAKITATTQGSENPIAPNDTEEGRAKNRRTVITVN